MELKRTARVEKRKNGTTAFSSAALSEKREGGGEGNHESIQHETTILINSTGFKGWIGACGDEGEQLRNIGGSPGFSSLGTCRVGMITLGPERRTVTCDLQIRK